MKMNCILKSKFKLKYTALNPALTFTKLTLLWFCCVYNNSFNLKFRFQNAPNF